MRVMVSLLFYKRKNDKVNSQNGEHKSIGGIMRKKMNRSMSRVCALLLTLVFITGTAAGCTDGASGSTDSSAQQDVSSAETSADASAEATGEGESTEAAGFYSFPEIGTENNGFVLQEVRDFDVIGAKVGLFEHKATGAKLMYINNDDINRVFDLTFNTQAVDNTGMPHVFEHSTLDGSKKYPSKELFFNLSYQTYQTYMNAMTSDRTTTYPVASLSEAQLLKLADYYTDSCFFPMIMEDESIYQEEAWRYRMEDKDAPFTIEGTVYSEMRGSLTKSARAYYNTLRTSLPGSFIGNVSGGDPEFIPDMGWQDLKDFHDRFYHPSNCTAYLYGDIKDIEPFMALLDETFSQFDKKEFTVEDPDYKPIEEAAVAEIPSPAEEGTVTENASIVYYSMVVGELTDDEKMQMDALLSMLEASSSDLVQTLQKELPTGSFSAGRELAGPEDLVMFGIENVNREDADKFKSIVDEAIAKVVSDGFPEELVEGVMASQDMDNKLTRERDDVGVNIIYSFGYNAAISGDPFYLISVWDSAEKIADWNQDDTYKNLAQKYLTDQKRNTLVTTYPQPGLVEENDAILAKQLEELKAGMTEDEIAQLVAKTRQEEMSDSADDLADEAGTDASDTAGTDVSANVSSDASDTAGTDVSANVSGDTSDTASADASEAASDVAGEDTTAADAQTESYVKQLTAVTVDELPEEIKEYEVKDEIGEDNVRYLEAVAAVEGVGLADIFLDAQGIEQEDIHYFMLLRNMTEYLDTTKHTRQELESLKTIYTYNPSVGVTTLLDASGEKVMPVLSFSFIVSDENLEKAYELMAESIFDLKLDDEQKLLDSISSLIANRRTGAINSPHTMLYSHTAAAVSEAPRYSDYLAGFAYYAFLEEVQQKLTDGDSKEIIERLQKVQEQLKNRTNTIVLFAGNEESIAKNRECADAFLQSLNAEEITRVEYDLPSPAAFEGVILESQVQYNAEIASFEDLGLTDGYTADLDVLSSVISDQFLYPLLRDQYGAYGAMHGFADQIGGYIISYRDPNVTQTFDVYKQLPDLVAGMELDQETLNGYILSTYSYYAKPAGELSGAISAMNLILTGRTQAEKLDYMREIKAVTPETIKAYADVYKNLYEKGVKSTAGGATAINSNAELYDEILNPFGAPTEAISFEDVTDETENAEYIMMAAEAGLMQGVSETEFGVDEESTVADMAIALYIFGSGDQSYDAEADLQFLVKYGIADSSLKVTDKLTGKIYKDMVNGLYNAMGADPSELDLDAIKDDEVITRGMLAKYLLEE